MSQAIATLYQKLGGEPAIQAVVDEFYKRVLADNELKHYFAKSDMNQLKRHQTRFIGVALGAANQDAGRPVWPAHTGMNITEAHFMRVAGHLTNALKWAKVERDDINTILSTVGSLKGDIVGH